MKNILFLSIILLLIPFGNSFGQNAPEGINYQAAIRNVTSNEPLTDSLVALQLSILSGSVDGPEVYSEVHFIQTDQFGLVNLVIGGSENIVTGNFADINWGSNRHFLKTFYGTPDGFVELGTTELVSVPYALFAKEAGTAADDNDRDPTNELYNDEELRTSIAGIRDMIPDSLSELVNDAGFLTSVNDGDTDPTNELYDDGPVNNRIDSLGNLIPNALSQLMNDAGFITSADDADNDPTNELYDDAPVNNRIDSLGNLIPEALSQLTNDVGFVTSADDADNDPTNELYDDASVNNRIDSLGGLIPDALSQLTNDAGFITSADNLDNDPTNELYDDASVNNRIDSLGNLIPGALSQLTNDAGFITSADDADNDPTNELYDDASVNNRIDSLGGLIPDALSQLTNDAGFITSADNLDNDPTNELYEDGPVNNRIDSLGGLIPDALSQLTNDAGFITSADNLDNDPTNELYEDGPVNNRIDSLGGLIPNALSQLTNDAGFIDNPNDADSDPFNELQTLSFNSATNQLSIEPGGNTVTLSSGGGGGEDFLPCGQLDSPLPMDPVGIGACPDQNSQLFIQHRVDEQVSNGLRLEVSNDNTSGDIGIARGMLLEVSNGSNSNDGVILLSRGNISTSGIKLNATGGEKAVGIQIVSGEDETIDGFSVDQDDFSATDYGLFIDQRHDENGFGRNGVGVRVMTEDENDYAAILQGRTIIGSELPTTNDDSDNSEREITFVHGAWAGSNNPNRGHGVKIENSGGAGNNWTFYAANGINSLHFFSGDNFATTLSPNGTFTASDKRLKERIEPIGDVLSGILSLEPKKYLMKSDVLNKPTLGFLAQDVEQIFPSLVQRIKEGVPYEDGLLTLNYSGFSVLAIKAIQEQQALIEEQNNQLSTQQAKIDGLAEELADLRAVVNQVLAERKNSQRSED